MELKHEWRNRKLYVNDLHIGTLKQTSPQWPAKGCWERFHYQGSFIDFDMEDKSINARCAEIAKRWYMAYVSNHKDSLKELIADESIHHGWTQDAVGGYWQGCRNSLKVSGGCLNLTMTHCNPCVKTLTLPCRRLSHT